MADDLYKVTYAGGEFATTADGVNAIADAVDRAIDEDETIVLTIIDEGSRRVRLLVGRGIPIMFELPE